MWGLLYRHEFSRSICYRHNFSVRGCWVSSIVNPLFSWRTQPGRLPLQSLRIPQRYHISTNAKKNQENIATIPNFITVGRMVVTPYLGHLIIQHEYETAMAVFACAAFSDFADGWIARNIPKQGSMLGAVIDPIADKLLIGVTSVSLAMAGIIPASLVGLMLFRDVGLMATSFYLRYTSLKPHVDGPVTLKQYWDFSHPTVVVHPSSISKLNTVVQFALISASICAPVFSFVDHPALQALWWITATTTFASGVSYLTSKTAIEYIQPAGKK